MTVLGKATAAGNGITSENRPIRHTLWAESVRQRGSDIGSRIAKHRASETCCPSLVPLVLLFRRIKLLWTADQRTPRQIGR